jgi:hypothetical protein
VTPSLDGNGTGRYVRQLAETGAGRWLAARTNRSNLLRSSKSELPDAGKQVPRLRGLGRSGACLKQRPGAAGYGEELTSFHPLLSERESRRELDGPRLLSGRAERSEALGPSLIQTE